MTTPLLTSGLDRVVCADALLREEYGIIGVSSRAGNTEDVSQRYLGAPAMVIVPPLKRCSRCHNSLPATPEYFYRSKSCYDGLYHMCKPCRSEYERANRARWNNTRQKRDHENHEKLSAYARERRKEKGEQINAGRRERYQETIDHQREVRRDYYSANKEKMRARANLTRDNIKNRERAKAWRTKYPERVKDAQKAWATNNPEKVRANWHKRRLRERNAEGNFTAADIKYLYQCQKGKCYWCGKSLKYGKHIDHVIPLARGGSNHPSNIVLACPKCNLSRKDKLPHEWGDKLL